MVSIFFHLLAVNDWRMRSGTKRLGMDQSFVQAYAVRRLEIEKWNNKARGGLEFRAQ